MKALLLIVLLLPFLRPEPGFCQFPQVPGLMLYKPIDELAACQNTIIASVLLQGIYRSIDGGNSWVLSYKTDDFIRNIAASKNNFFFATDDYICRSTDLGVSW